MSADIVERLLEDCLGVSDVQLSDHADPFGSITCGDLREAAAEIVRLRGEVEATAMLNLVDGWVLEVFRGIDGELGVWARNESNARVWIARTKGGQSE